MPIVQKIAPCLWLDNTRFGVWWQIVPRVIVAMITDADRAKPERVMNACCPRGLLKMKKLDIAALERAFAG
jgi:predicted 3-demethylubiquinone-9 3-methyltransferase (glyoxalase superfamily)